MYHANRRIADIETKFVTCLNCEDYDLCFKCNIAGKSGHHPAHTFLPVCKPTDLPIDELALCTANRNFRHFATCDGCDEVR
jgi:next to BRCA1 gene 1 protein